MSELATILARFNRKERNLLFRAIFGDNTRRLPLDPEFLKDVSCSLGLQPPIDTKEEVWWASDYHISWVAGALAIYAEGDEAVVNKPRPNRAQSSLSLSEPRPTQMIESNQEDFDFLVASGRNLILIEAKGFGNFDEEQIQSKLDRLNLIYTEYKERLEKNIAPDRQIRFYFLLMSPEDPTEVKVNIPNWLPPKLPWMKLFLPGAGSILKVSRCDQKGKVIDVPSHWKVRKA